MVKSLKNIVYNICVTLFLSALLGLLNYFCFTHDWVGQYIIGVIAFGFLSWLIDWVKIKTLCGCHKIQIKRLFVPFRVRAFYLYIVYSLVLSLAITWGITFFVLKDNALNMPLFMGLFIFFYLNVFTIYQITLKREDIKDFEHSVNFRHQHKDTIVSYVNYPMLRTIYRDYLV